jgi:arylsulfatase A-like enzyme
MNFIIFLVDDLGHDDVAYLGGKTTTPNIDQLAHDGMIFTNAYSGGPVCSPSRSAMMTGESPGRLWFTEVVYPPHIDLVVGPGDPNEGPPNCKVIGPHTRQILPKDVPTLPEILKADGYTTAIIGKWHLTPFHNGNHPTPQPKEYGFDEQIGWGGAGTPKFPPWDVEDLKPHSPDEHITDRLTDESVNFVTRNKDKPFFLYLAHYSVHEPWKAKASDIPRHMSDFANSVYLGELNAVDRSLGRIRQALSDLGIADHTAIIFASDNGPVIYSPGSGKDPDMKLSDIPEGARVTSLETFRAEKGSLFEGGIRIPMIFYVPGVTAAGSTNRTPMVNYDFLPTLVDLSGHPLPAGLHLDGRSLVPELKGGEDYNRAVYFHRPDYMHYWLPDVKKIAISEGPRSAIRQGKYKYIMSLDGGPDELYDLEADLGERTNIAASDPTDLARLKAELVAWQKDANVQMPIPNPHYNGQQPPLPIPAGVLFEGKLTAEFDELQ